MISTIYINKFIFFPRSIWFSSSIRILSTRM
nr:MAG TPA: hypothetical protein [Caudoviricetes sp.]